jgi:two-component system sensor histidine kinase AtoS
MKLQYKYILSTIIIITLTLNSYIIFTSLNTISQLRDIEYNKVLSIQRYIDYRNTIAYSSLDSSLYDIFKVNNFKVFNLERILLYSEKGNNRITDSTFTIPIKNKIEICNNTISFIIPRIDRGIYITGTYNSTIHNSIRIQKVMITFALSSSIAIVLIFIIVFILAFKPMVNMEYLARGIRDPDKNEIFYKFVPDVFRETIEELKRKNKELNLYYQNEKEHSKDIEAYFQESMNALNLPIYIINENTLLYSNSFGENLMSTFPDIIDTLKELNQSREIVFGERTFFTSINKIERSGKYIGNVFILFDFTYSKQKDLIANSIITLQNLGNMAVNITHEFKNSLGIITGYIQILKKKIDCEEIDILEKESQYMLNSINKFLEICKINKIEKEQIDVKGLICDIVKLSKHIGLKLRYTYNVNHLFIDKDLFMQVIRNLFINSKEANADLINLSIYNRDKYRIIKIEDNGKGFTNNAKQNALIPFFSEKENGSGIGLTFINKIVLLHNGILTIDNSNIGASITIALMEDL